VNENKIREALRIATEMEAFGGQLLIKNLLTEALAPPQRFYKGQPVLVSIQGIDWSKRTLLRIEDLSKSYAYMDTISQCWDHCKPNLDAVSLPNWIEHDGSDHGRIVAKGAIINVIRTDGESYHHREAFYLNDGIARYCIIPLPEFL